MARRRKKGGSPLLPEIAAPVAVAAANLVIGLDK